MTVVLREGAKIRTKFGGNGMCVEKGRIYEVKRSVLTKEFYFECRCGYFGIITDGFDEAYELVSPEALSPVEQYIARELARVDGETA